MDQGVDPDHTGPAELSPVNYTAMKARSADRPVDSGTAQATHQSGYPQALFTTSRQLWKLDQ
jgi:hypothetical protein